jgi:hypothetical protein
MVGATRESVNRSLAALASRGLLRVEDRRYVLPDPDALATEATADNRGTTGPGSDVTRIPRPVVRPR